MNNDTELCIITYNDTLRQWNRDTPGAAGLSRGTGYRNIIGAPQAFAIREEIAQRFLNAHPNLTLSAHFE